MAYHNYDIPKHSTLSFGSTKIFFRKYGEGYPVICLPPWMNSSVAYAPLAHQLKDSGLQLFALDMPGWGKHTKVAGTPIDIDTYIHLLFVFIKKMKFNKYSIIGYSFGGVVAQGAITVENITPEKLILVSTLNGGFDIFDIRFKTAVRQLSKVKESLDRKNALKKAYIFARKLHIIFKPSGKTKDLAYIDLLLRDLGPISIPNALDSIYSLYGRSFLSSKLKRINTVLIMGDKDHKYVKNGMKEISKYIDRKITIIDKANHHHLVLRPEKSADIIKNALI